MRDTQGSRQQTILIIGDLATLFLVTIAGFARHGELGTTGLRLLSTFVPLGVAWFLVAPHLGVFDIRRAHDPKQLWRPFWSMILAAPLACWVRGVWLDSPVLPVFVAVLGGICAAALLAWRGLYLAARRGRWVTDG